MFFSNPLTEGIFRGSKSELSLKRAILERSAIFRGAENGPIISNNISENHKKSSPPVSGERPGADLGAKWHRKRPKTTQGSNLIDFLMKLDSFGIDFLCNSHDF